MHGRPGSAGDPLLVVEGASRAFVSGGETVWAVREVDLQARVGEFVCLFGASGSGKTTLLNLIAGLDTPSAGTVR
jgi:putative ABC transport system ATP-binding protein